MKKKITVLTILAAMAALTALGLAFCWYCPDRWYDSLVHVPHWFFTRQLSWIGIGVAVFVMAVLVGWKRWIAAAPFIFIAWMALYVGAHMQPMRDGAYTFVRLGPVSLNVVALLPLALALMLSWISDKLKIPPLLLLLSTAGVVLFTMGVMVALNPNRLARLTMFLNETSAESASAVSHMFVQQKLRAALASAGWFSSGDLETLRDLPGVFTHSMPGAAAVVFGKWFLALEWLLFGGLAVGLGCLLRGTRDLAKRMFLLVAGFGGVLFPAIVGFCECFSLAPMLYTCVPMASYGGSIVYVLLGAGILVSAVSDGEEVT